MGLIRKMRHAPFPSRALPSALAVVPAAEPGQKAALALPSPPPLPLAELDFLFLLPTFSRPRPRCTAMAMCCLHTLPLPLVRTAFRNLRCPRSLLLRLFSTAAPAQMKHHLMVGTWTPPGAIFTLQFDDEALTLNLLKKTPIPYDEPISWMTFDVSVSSCQSNKSECRHAQSSLACQEEYLRCGHEEVVELCRQLSH